MSNYTKGPWFVEHDTDTIRSGGQSQDGLNPNSTEVQVFGSDEGTANARLIACAPELLQALKLLIEVITLDKDATKNNGALSEFAWSAGLVVTKAEGSEK